MVLSSNLVQRRQAAATAWLDAIEAATNCLRSSGGGGGGGGSSSSGTLSTEELASAMSALSQLEAWIIALPEEEWHSLPRHHPPAAAASSNDSFPTTSAPLTTLIPSQVHSIPATSTSGNVRLNNNPFASIALPDDSDDEEDHVDEEDEAGDQPVLHESSPLPTHEQGMTLLRLLIRIRTSISDLWAHQSRTLADTHDWTEACVSLVNAITKSREAMYLADSQISLFLHQREHDNSNDTTSNHQSLEALQLDADIVHVAVQHVVQCKDRYHELAQRQINKLERFLRPQWESRDEVKNRMGAKRWNNNPNPKKDYAVLREESEEELSRLQNALASLEEADVDALAALALAMKTRLEESNGQRYNGKRPEDTGILLDRLDGFPDATEYGWTFTGSHPPSYVEFFEKVIEGNIVVKLDWYYTTATIKTSMDHPRQGKTQMFARARVTPDLYIQILENPRVHTDQQRYQRRNPSAGHQNHSNRGRMGRGFGRQGGRQAPRIIFDHTADHL